ncbi:MAG TPA: ankyrin repeat domain-containing protein [Phycisphaerae bacterium]|nr:ankyrin repeat domain-containing protein [Phycisphaerae bacterium]
MASILPLPPAVVGETVGRSHADLGRVRELVTQYPTVVNAAWDWGNGDWETPLGAAAHTGRRDIAEFLLSKGARLDLFSAAALGKLPLLKAFLSEDASLADSKGPHGISLLDHAKTGGHRDVIAYLEALLFPDRKPRAPRKTAIAARAIATKGVAKKLNGAKHPKKVRAR